MSVQLHVQRATDAIEGFNLKERGYFIDFYLGSQEWHDVQITQVKQGSKTGLSFFYFMNVTYSIYLPFSPSSGFL